MIEKKLSNKVAVVETDKSYPDFPYGQNSSLNSALLDLLEKLGLSRDNPFAYYIKPGQTALIKPNLVRDRNPLGHDLDSLITHASLIKYILDLLAKAMEGRGKVIIADAPLQNCNFENLMELTKIERMVEAVKNEHPALEIAVEDWRLTTMKNSSAKTREVQDYEETSPNHKLVDLGKESFLEEISSKADRFRVTKYRPSLMLRHHTKGKHEYLITRRIHEVDFFVNLPKMKTHIKAGLTGAMKNLVGINGHKEFLPHHIKGSPAEGGDNYPKSSWLRRRYEDLYDYLWENINNISFLKRKVVMKLLEVIWKISSAVAGDNVSAGSWAGNDTIWRTTLDLNHIAYFGSERPYKVLNIVDGIIAGEGEGPLEPTPRPAGILVAGENPALVDAALAKIMGYDLRVIKTVDNALHHENSELKASASDIGAVPQINFKKPKYWR